MQFNVELKIKAINKKFLNFIFDSPIFIVIHMIISGKINITYLGDMTPALKIE